MGFNLADALGLKKVSNLDTAKKRPPSESEGGKGKYTFFTHSSEVIV